MTTTVTEKNATTAAPVDPLWQWEKCPLWCQDAQRGHGPRWDDARGTHDIDWMHPDDRSHWGATLRLPHPLELMPPQHFEGGWEPPSLELSMRQKWREVEPLITLLVNDRDVLHLTMGEAMWLHDALDSLLDQAAEGAQR